MSRVHDALRRAEQFTSDQPAAAPAGAASAILPPTLRQTAAAAVLAPSLVDGLLGNIRDIAFTPSADAHLVDFSKPHEAPSEEFRTLRTRLNHLQSLQPIHSVVVTSPSPAEGKSFAAMNLALTESQLEGN
ncbi:MAG TPA: capsular biosynthesis protein, partial [Bryobacteraceae bacterium]|nr:capsular biosynthesis protein [Bryobacteraceae bacterium]